MASFGIHLAIANKYLESHNEENKDEFIKGTLDVDLAEDKIASHYTRSTDHSNLITFLSGKVDLNKYVETKKIDTSYDRGYFLHLITDYYFYTSFFAKEWLNSINYDEFKKVIYHDYASLNGYLIKKYNVEYPDIIKKYSSCIDEDNIIITEEAIDSFINDISTIDLDNLYSSLINNQKIR